MGAELRNQYLIVGLGAAGLSVLSRLKHPPGDEVQYLFIGYPGTEERGLKNKITDNACLEIDLDPQINLGDYAHQENYQSWFSLDAFENNGYKIRKEENRIVARLALFLNSDKIYRRLDSIIHPNLKVIIVGSLSCGLTSGIFIDVAYLIRNMFWQQYKKKLSLAGFFLLSPPSDQYDKDLALGNSYASLMELNHYQNSTLDFQAQYKQDFNLTINVQGEPFDIVYLFDTTTDKKADCGKELVRNLGHWLSTLIDNQDLCNKVWPTDRDFDKSDWLRSLSVLRIATPTVDSSHDNGNAKDVHKNELSSTPTEHVSTEEDIYQLFLPGQDLSFYSKLPDNLPLQWVILIPGIRWEQERWIRRDLQEKIKSGSPMWFSTKDEKDIIVFRETRGYQLRQLRDLNKRQGAYYELKSKKEISLRSDEDKLTPYEASGGNPARNTNLSLFPATIAELEIGNTHIRITDIPIDELQVDVIASDQLNIVKIKLTAGARRVYPLCDDFKNATIYSFRTAIKLMLKDMVMNDVHSAAISLAGLKLNIHRVIKIIIQELHENQVLTLNDLIIHTGCLNELFRNAINNEQISPESIEEELLLIYPFPIAYIYQRFWLNRMWKRENIYYAQKTLETILKFMGTIILAEYASSNKIERNKYLLKEEKKINIKTHKENSELGGKLTTDFTAGTWLEIMDNCIGPIEKPIIRTYINSEFLDFYESIDRRATKYRNQIIHGESFSNSDLDDLSDILIKMWNDLSWLEDYTLVYIDKYLEIEKRYLCHILSGWDPSFPKGLLECELNLNNGVALINSRQNMILYLNPYIMYKEKQDIHFPYELLWIDHINKSTNNKKIFYKSWLNMYNEKDQASGKKSELIEVPGWSYFEDRFLFSMSLEKNVKLQANRLRLIRVN